MSPPDRERACDGSDKLRYFTWLYARRPRNSVDDFAKSCKRLPEYGFIRLFDMIPEQVHNRKI